MFVFACRVPSKFAFARRTKVCLADGHVISATLMLIPTDTPFSERIDLSLSLSLSLFSQVGIKGSKLARKKKLDNNIK